jgi:hypothetical protein
MGADTFIDTVSGKDAAEAFAEAQKAARHLYGHSGYTGTIAEKDSFILYGPVPEGMTVDTYVAALLNNQEEPIDDKWGPAGCLKIGEDKYMFFGWASS